MVGENLESIYFTQCERSKVQCKNTNMFVYKVLSDPQKKGFEKKDCGLYCDDFYIVFHSYLRVVFYISLILLYD